MSVSSYRDLKVWQAAMDLVEHVYELTGCFPKHELYGLTSQIQRSAISIPSNIAEGHSRASSKEFLHYISIALGSVAELETQLMLAGRLKYVGQNDTQCAIARLEDIGKMLRGLQKSLKSKLHSSP